MDRARNPIVNQREMGREAKVLRKSFNKVSSFRLLCRTRENCPGWVGCNQLPSHPVQLGGCRRLLLHGLQN